MNRLTENVQSGGKQVTYQYKKKKNQFLVITSDQDRHKRLHKAFTEAGLFATFEATVTVAVREMVSAAQLDQPYSAVFFDTNNGIEDYEWLANAIRQRSPIAHTKLFPLAGDAESPEDAVPLEMAPIEAARCSQFQGTTSFTAEGGGRSLPQFHLNVLLVEDDHFSQIVCRSLLKKFGCTFTLAVDGSEAVKLARDHTYDLILMDIRLPVMNGYEATAAIREGEKGRKRTPIIALTANVMRSDRSACKRADMDDFISKPVTTEALQGVLNACLSKNFSPVGDARVLIVEENAYRRNELADSITTVLPHVNVDCLETGVAACEYIFTVQPKLVVIDAAMGDIDVTALLRHLNKKDNRPEVIALSVLDEDSGRVQELLRLGARAVLRNPPETGQLVKMIGEFLSGKKAGEGQFSAASPLDDISNGEESLKQLFLERLRKTLPPDIQSLRDALSKGEFDQAETLAHRLKSTSGYIGHEPFQDLARTIEKACRHDKLDKDRAQEFEQQVDMESKALFAVLESIPASNANTSD